MTTVKRMMGAASGPFALAALVLVASGCSTSSEADVTSVDTDGPATSIPAVTEAPATTQAPATSSAPTGDDAVAEFVAAYESAAADLRSAVFITVDPWRDLTAAIDQLRAADPLLDDFERALPDRMPDDVAPQYEAVVEAIAAWRTDAAVAADELEARLDEFQPLATEWVDFIEQGGDEPPPAEVRTLVDAGRDAADRLAQACTELANAADVLIDCFSLFAEPG